MEAHPLKSHLTIREATEHDVDLIYSFIRGLADYEKLLHEAVLTEDDIRKTLFGDRRFAEVLIAEVDKEPAGFALYFYKYSTFLGRPGLYLEDLFVNPDKRGLGVGSALLKHLARMCVDNNYGRLEWCVLDWNKPAIDVYDRIGARQMNDWITYRLDGEALKTLADR